MKQKTNISSSIRDSIGRRIHQLSEAEFELATIEATNEAPEAHGQELEKSILKRVENRRDCYANGATHGTSEFWERVRMQATDEARRILTSTTGEAVQIELLRAEAADKLAEANARQANFSRNSSELSGLPKLIDKVTESLQQVTSAKAGLDKAKLEESFKNSYIASVFAQDIQLFHKHRMEADALYLALSSRSLRIAALEKYEGELTAQLKQLADRQAEPEKLLS